MYKFLEAGAKKVSQDLYISSIYSLNMGQSIFGYISPLSTKQFCELSRKHRYFTTLEHKDRVQFIFILRDIEIRLLYLQVSEENIAGITEALSDIFVFLMKQPKKYLEKMEMLAKASKYMTSLGNDSQINPCALYNIDILDESPEQVLAVVNEYRALTDQLVAAFKRCNPASLEVEQNNPQAENAYYNFNQCIYASWVVFLVLTIAGNCSAKDSLLNNYVPVFNSLLIILNLVLGIDFVMTNLRMIKNNENQYKYLLMVLASLSAIIVRAYSWRNFHADKTLKPSNMSELAEKIYYLCVQAFTLEGVPAVVKDYLLENETVNREFNAELFVQALEKELVDGGRAPLSSVVYNGGEVTHEALVTQVEEVVAALLDVKNDSAMLNQGWFGRTAASVAQGLTNRIGFANK